MLENKCKICGNQNDNKLFLIKERMLNKGESFHYLLCAKCGTLQLNDKVESLTKYYLDNYGAYKKISDKQFQKFSLVDFIKQKIIIFGGYLFYKEPLFNMDRDSYLERLSGTKISRNAKIIDIGCGVGTWLQDLENRGFNNLTGVDLFCPRFYKDSKCKFIEGDIFSVGKQKFDLISLHHSFEHMEEPLKVLEKIYSLLEDEGTCVIAIPLMGKRAWREYKECWFQIDAPRHIYLYTERALNYLCNKTGLHIKRVIYNSIEEQFRISEAYQKTNKSFKIILTQIGDTKINKANRKKAKKVNRLHDGDRAIFFIKKKDFYTS